MASFNQVILLGNLTRDPQLKYLPNQTPVVEFGIATNRKWKGPNGEDREEVTFVDCAAFARQAEVINQYCQKGKQIMIQGRLKFDQWEDKQGGGKRSKLSVVVETFQLLGSRGDAGQGGGGGQGGGNYEEHDQRPASPQRGGGAPQGRGPAPQGQRQQSAPPPQQPFGEEEQFKEDDIPF
jgi:single-strand DNA-binding protein